MLCIPRKNGWLIKVCLEFVLVIWKSALASCVWNLWKKLQTNDVLASFIHNDVTPLEQKNEWVNKCDFISNKIWLKQSLFQWFRNLLWWNVWSHQNKLQMTQILFVMMSHPIRSSLSLVYQGLPSVYLCPSQPHFLLSQITTEAITLDIISYWKMFQNRTALVQIQRAS